MKITVDDDYLSPNEPLMEKDTDFMVLCTDDGVCVFGYVEPNSLIMAVSDIVEKSYRSLVDIIDKYNEVDRKEAEENDEDDYEEIIKPEFEEYLVGIMINAFSKRHGLENKGNDIQVDVMKDNKLEKVNLDVLNYFKQSINYNLNNK